MTALSGLGGSAEGSQENGEADGSGARVHAPEVCKAGAPRTDPAVIARVTPRSRQINCLDDTQRSGGVR